MLQELLLGEYLYGQVDILTILEEDRLPDQDICIRVNDDIALISYLLTLVDLFGKASDEVDIEGVFDSDDEPIAIET